MSYEVGVVGHFQAQHHLVGNFGPASEPHAHDYRVDASVTGDDLRADGTLFDITLLQSALRETLGQLDGRDLNEIEPLATPNPTAELVAHYVFERVSPALRGRGLVSLRVRVWESDDAYASYSRALG